MNKRCIVNVATGEFYCKMQSRLFDSFDKVTDKSRTYSGQTYLTRRSNNNKGIDLILWYDCLPPGSRPHSESPYGFKVHAIKAAYEMGYTSILWLDSPAQAVKEDISPIFDKIEKEGYYAMSHIDPLPRYVGYKAMHFFNKKYVELEGFNLPSGSCYGFDFNGIGHRLFERQLLFELNDLFYDRADDASEYIVHRHDEAILALNLMELTLPVFTFDPLFQSDSPECVIKSGG